MNGENWGSERLRRWTHRNKAKRAQEREGERETPRHREEQKKEARKLGTRKMWKLDTETGELKPTLEIDRRD